MTTHSSMYACRIPWTEEPGRLQPIVTELNTTEVTQHTGTPQRGNKVLLGRAGLGLGVLLRR